MLETKSPPKLPVPLDKLPKTPKVVAAIDALNALYSDTTEPESDLADNESVKTKNIPPKR